MLHAFDRACDCVIWLLLRTALAVESCRRLVRRRSGKIRASLRRLLRTFELCRSRARFVPARKRPWNRTAADVEESVVRLHVEQPQLGLGQLRRLAERVLGFTAARETFRQILLRRQPLVEQLEDARRGKPRRIDVSDPGVLWGVDLTLLWVLGFFPCWVVGAVDYYGSRVVAFERVSRPSSEAVARVLERAFDVHGAPERLLTDRAAIFASATFKELLERRGVAHSRIRPGHAWTNGRIERVFRTFKDTVGQLIWLFASRRQADCFCADFARWYNVDRPHSRWGGRTPQEVHRGRRRKRGKARGRVTYFDGHLCWYKFG